MTGRPSSAVDFAKSLGITFSDAELLSQVFVHRSYLNEHRSLGLDHNERLEFLGDAVLELVVTEHLYRNFPNPEGELTNWRSALVRGQMIATIAKELGMEPHLLLSRGEQQSKGKARQLILANTFEAFIGALYLDRGYEAAQSFLNEHLILHLSDILAQRLHIDSKSDLQEKSQEHLGVTPTYTVLKSEGPDHDKIFTVGVQIGGTMVAEGTGSSKQRAEQSAAAQALEKWDEISHAA
ncbi:ribonuclease III [Candidatus Berkelbacteria bacterium]|nr:ribonuclease III [Candidatus Berkelbacteria bacterium]